jgi:hypothetical protein
MYIIRTSDRGQFKNCRQKWDFGSKIRQNYEPIIGIKPLDFGTAIHAGLEAYYNPLTWDTPQLREALALSTFAATNNEQKTKYLSIHQDGELVAELDTDFEERNQLGLDMLHYYFSWAPEMDEDFVPVFTEVEFEVPILVPGDISAVSMPDRFSATFPSRILKYKGEQVMYQGRIDLIVQSKSTGRYRIRDHKTRAQFGSLEFLQLDDQGTSYGWAIEHSLGIDVEAIEFNELRKAAPHEPQALKNGGLSVNKQQNTTYDLFVKKCHEMGLSLATYQPFLEYLTENPKEFCRRVVVHKTAKEYEIQSRRIFLEAIDMLNDPAIYPNPNPSWMGCPGCPFFNPCQATQDGGDVQYFLDEMFRKRPETEAAE